MLTNKLLASANKIVSYSSGAITSTTSITVPAITSGQMLVLVDRANSGTAPALKAGYTNILTVQNTTAARSIRVSYYLGPANSATVTFSAYGGYSVLNNATTFGATNTVVGTGTTSTSLTIPSLSGVSTAGTSIAVFYNYTINTITAVTSPYTLISGIGGYTGRLTASTLAQGTATSSSGVYDTGCTIEFRP